MTERNGGHKICQEVACDIKRYVQKAIAASTDPNKKVDPDTVEICRNLAKVDAAIHLESDRDFLWGKDPAVKTRSPIMKNIY